ncbi:MAG: tRNA (adenosine(37)-N6)-dimethylallyltransferase MiaA [Actinomycetota bacterium]|nr:tRNA (adenosine(37)-N6)-dimethylallyltransferase MiaA [Actinomycetota bacterium]
MAAACVLALVGPTGTGKSGVALDVVHAAAGGGGPPVEIVAVDAFTVYRGMDIGTAKPTAQQRAGVRHHLVDALDPWQDCSVEWFQRSARAAIAEVLERGATPLLVGGSGLYFRAVVDPLEFPPTDPAVRAAVARHYGDDAGKAHAALLAVDPEAAARMDPANLRRAVRALEVVQLTGRPFSAWRQAWDNWEPLYAGLRTVGMQVARPALAARLDDRVDAMVAAGLVDECRALARRPLSVTARQAIGYAEILDHFDGRWDLDDAVATIKRRTRRYAARQERWFARDPRLRWVPPPQAPEVLLAACSS